MSNLDTSFTTYPWGWYDRYVGSWTIGIPLNKDRLQAYGRGYILDIISDTLGILSDMYIVTRVECPYKTTLFDRPMPLRPGDINHALEKRWDHLTAWDSMFSPCAYFYGLSYTYALNRTSIVRALVPGVLGFHVESDLHNDEMPMASLTVLTGCDLWLQRTLNGYDNRVIGALNGELLTEKLRELEKRLCGKIVSYRTGFSDEVDVSRYQIKNK